MGIFDRMYYGKAGKADYTAEDLPHNRFQLFFEVLRVRLWQLIGVNLLQVIFWIPFIIWTFINVSVLISMETGDGTQSAEQLAYWGQQALAYLQVYLLGLIPCIAITGPSTAAASYITRNWARDQHSFVLSDFKDAFKDNWKQALAVSTITSLVPSIAYLGYRFYGEMALQYPVLFIAQILVVLVCFVWLIMLPLLYPLMVCYKLTFKQLIRNALLLSVGRLPHIVGTRLLLLIPMAITLGGLFLANTWMILFGLLYYLLIGLGMSRLVYASVANGFFDKFINPRIEGAQVNRGLYQDDDDDDDDDDEEE